MISYHPESKNRPVGENFTPGFVTVATDDPREVAEYMKTFSWAPGVFRSGYRCRENYIKANWLGLDFDSPETSLAEIIRAVCDMVHVIGTTRSHQVEKNGVTCDRFRLALLAENFMTGPEYLATLRHLAKKWPIDMSCVDTGRHFYRCQEIVSVGDSDGYKQEIIPPPPPPTRAEILRQEARSRMARMRFERNGSLPIWVNNFLKHGTLIQSGGRNNTIYAVTVALNGFGLSERDIENLINKAPIPRHDLDERAVLATIRSGMRRKNE